MIKKYYQSEEEKQQVIEQAKQNDWLLKEDAITKHGRYLVFDVRTDKRIKELEQENEELKIQHAQNSMEIFNALSVIETQNEINQATMLMEILDMIIIKQGDE